MEIKAAFLEIGINAIDSTLIQQPIAEKERANAEGRAEEERDGRGGDCI